MTAPGWYQAEGDPPGTTRYWDGERWIGEAVSTPVAPQGGTAAGTFPSSLKTLTIVVSVLKALGWAGLLIGTIWVVSFLDDANDFDSTFGSDAFGDAIGALAATMAVILIIGGVLLFLQMRAANRGDAGALFTVALIMAILDGLATVLSFFGAISEGGNIIGFLIYAGIFAAQVRIAMQAKQAS